MILLAEALSVFFALKHNINPKIIKLILLTEALSVSFGLSPAACDALLCHHKLLQRIIKLILLCRSSVRVLCFNKYNNNPMIIKLILLIEALSVSFGLSLTPTSKNN
jgi:hypothetical protein